MSLPKVVTFTGADDSVKAKDILKVSKAYPDTEWGILFGGPTNGAPRYPSRLWLASELPKLKGLNLTAHLCGNWVYDLVLRGDFTWLYAFSGITTLFQRIQLNFHGMEFPPAARSFHPRIQDEPFQFIFQDDEVNGHLMQHGTINEVRLFDVSHGAGVLPGEEGETNPWPKRTKYEYMGYAGGLGPDNIVEQLKLITESANPASYGNFWIDMESKVRSKVPVVDGLINQVEDIFDLKKVRQVCKKVWG